MKKSLLVASLLAVALAACGKKEEPKPAVDAPQPPAVVAPAETTPAPATAAPAETTPVAPAAGDAAKKQ